MSGTSNPTEAASSISNRLLATLKGPFAGGVRSHSCNDGPDGTTGDKTIGSSNNECAEYNSQALYTNADDSLSCEMVNPAALSNRWIQLEGGIDWPSTDTRTSGATSAGWFQLMDAIRDPDVWGACDMTCAGGQSGTLGGRAFAPVPDRMLRLLPATHARLEAGSGAADVRATGQHPVARPPSMR